VRAVLVALAAVLAAGAAGCSGTVTPAPVAAATAGATADPSGLAAALLSVEDLPLGFQAQEGAGDAVALGCAGIDGVYLTAGVADHAAASFAHSLSPAFVNETITMRPGGAAATALSAFGAAAKDCAQFSGPDGTSYRVTAVPLPRYGDGSSAVRVTSGLTEGREVELAAVRLGDTVVAVAAAGTGEGDSDLTKTVVDRALAKLARTRSGH
jgi:hypothetical protein